jgi:hypothetical protein
MTRTRVLWAIYGKRHKSTDPNADPSCALQATWAGMPSGPVSAIITSRKSARPKSPGRANVTCYGTGFSGSL